MAEGGVVMLDHKDRTLHRAASGDGKHLQTACGLKMDGLVTVGPYQPLVRRALRLCPDCVYLGLPSSGT